MVKFENKYIEDSMKKAYEIYLKEYDNVVPMEYKPFVKKKLVDLIMYISIQQFSENNLTAYVEKWFDYLLRVNTLRDMVDYCWMEYDFITGERDYKIKEK